MMSKTWGSCRPPGRGKDAAGGLGLE